MTTIQPTLVFHRPLSTASFGPDLPTFALAPSLLSICGPYKVKVSLCPVSPLLTSCQWLSTPSVVKALIMASTDLRDVSCKLSERGPVHSLSCSLCSTYTTALLVLKHSNHVSTSELSILQLRLVGSSSPRYLHGSFLHLLQVFVQISLCV